MPHVHCDLIAASENCSSLTYGNVRLVWNWKNKSCTVTSNPFSISCFDSCILLIQAWTGPFPWPFGCVLSAAAEGQRALAHPHSLVQFLGSHTDSTVSFLPQQHYGLVRENVWPTASHMDHAQKQTRRQQLSSLWELELADVYINMKKTMTSFSEVEILLIFWVFLQVPTEFVSGPDLVQ